MPSISSSVQYNVGGTGDLSPLLVNVNVNVRTQIQILNFVVRGLEISIQICNMDLPAFANLRKLSSGQVDAEVGQYRYLDLGS